MVAVNDLGRSTDVPDAFVIVGAGKTATDANVWLVTNGAATAAEPGLERLAVLADIPTFRSSSFGRVPRASP